MFKKSKILLVLFVLMTFYSCKKDDKVIKTVSELKAKIGYNDSIVVRIDSSRKIEFRKNYIFRASQNGFQSAYGDLVFINNGTELLVTCVRAPQIQDFVNKNIYTAISKDKGKTWSSLRKIEHQTTGYLNVSAPSILRISDHHLIIFFGMKFSEYRIDILSKESFDGGISWSDDKIVYKPDVGYQTLNNNRVIYYKGRIIIPVAVPGNPGNLYKSIADNMIVYYLYSDDLGKTWSKSSDLKIDGLALLEPGIEALSNGELFMNIRLNIGTILFAKSPDFGQTWKYFLTKFDSPSSPQKIFRVDQSKLVMVWNNTKENYSLHGLNRNPLSIATTINNGKSWKIVGDIENKKGYDFSYPSITQDENQLYISYFETFPHGGHALKLATVDKKELFD